SSTATICLLPCSRASRNGLEPSVESRQPRSRAWSCDLFETIPRHYFLHKPHKLPHKPHKLRGSTEGNLSGAVIQPEREIRKLSSTCIRPKSELIYSEIGGRLMALAPAILPPDMSRRRSLTFQRGPNASA